MRTDGPGGKTITLSGVWRYFIALMAVTAAVAVRLALDPVAGQGQLLFTFPLAIVVSARVGGLGPGLLASFLTIPAAWYFLIEPRFSLLIANPRQVLSACIAAIVGVVITLLVARRDPNSDFEPLPGTHKLRRLVLFGIALVMVAVLTRLLNADFARESHRRQWTSHS